MKMIIGIGAIVTTVMLVVACTTQDIKSSVVGYKHAYTEPTSGPTATFELDGSDLKAVMGFHNTATAAFFDQCAVDNHRYKGYIGEVTISSDPKVGNARSVKVVAGKPIFMEFGTLQGGYECTTKFLINPKDGAKYRFEFFRGCSANAVQVLPSGERVTSADIEARRNEDGIFGASGDTQTTWRRCL